MNLNLLPHKVVLLELLDANDKPIKSDDGYRYATGFLTNEKDTNYLYTAWHVVTGADSPYSKKYPNPPRAEKLNIYSQDARKEGPGLSIIGGKKEFKVDLYTEHADKKLPTWKQDKQEYPDSYFNSFDIKIPFWHDLVKIKIDLPESMSENCTFKESDFFSPSEGLIDLGEKVIIPGYPYGYSSMGMEQPTPVVLTRFISATNLKQCNKTLLLDGSCSPVMSGSPVLIIRDNKLLLYGMYTGLVYPDYLNKKKSQNCNDMNDKHAALGRCNDITFALKRIVEGWG